MIVVGAKEKPLAEAILPECTKELQNIYQCLVTQLHTLEALCAFCEKYPKAKIGESEYHFFMNGHAADYWIRFVTRSNDYNLYLKGYAKGLYDRLEA